MAWQVKLSKKAISLPSGWGYIQQTSEEWHKCFQDHDSTIDLTIAPDLLIGNQKAIGLFEAAQLIIIFLGKLHRNKQITKQIKGASSDERALVPVALGNRAWWAICI